MRKRTMRNRRRGAFTLMEVLLVLVILVVLGSIAGYYISGAQGKAMRQAAQIQINAFGDCLEGYKLDVLSYPSSNQGLSALIAAPSDIADPNRWQGPYFAKPQIPRDPWGNEYQYQLDGPEAYQIWSLGPDGVDGSQDDIRSS
ncbi:MAG: type II secretion system major pseudopilin GspG [Pirellulaceae bacterium]|nr:type II secretion system major pseudopilin GspG [Planctomycetales bacterium]